jgi:hypothetical protein
VGDLSCRCYRSYGKDASLKLVTLGLASVHHPVPSIKLEQTHFQTVYMQLVTKYFISNLNPDHLAFLPARRVHLPPQLQHLLRKKHIPTIPQPIHQKIPHAAREHILLSIALLVEIPADHVLEDTLQLPLLLIFRLNNRIALLIFMRIVFTPKKERGARAHKIWREKRGVPV